MPEVDFSPFSLDVPMSLEGRFHANERQLEVGKEIYEILIRHGDAAEELLCGVMFFFPPVLWDVMDFVNLGWLNGPYRHSLFTFKLAILYRSVVWR